MQQGAGRGETNERNEVMRRGWSALLALLLVLVGAGFGSGTPRLATVAAPAHAGAGAADGRDALPVRAQSRPTLLAQRAADPPGTLPAPDALPGTAALAPPVPEEAAAALAARPVSDRPAGPRRPYQARAPPAAT